MTAMTQPALSVSGLAKAYGTTQAIKNISFSVAEGEVLGIVGPNGAGKTTLMEILEGLRTPDAGFADMFGVDLLKDIGPLRERRGVLMQAHSVPQLLKVRELLEVHALLYTNSMPVDELVEAVGLTEKAGVQVRSLSGGQKQRLAFAVAVIGNPDILFLDEPTSMLDPHGRRLVWDLLHKQLRDRPRTMLLTTHQMEEAEALCDQILMLNLGEVVASGTPDQLIQKYCPGQLVIIECDEQVDLSIPSATEAPAWKKVEGHFEAHIPTMDVEACIHELSSNRQKSGLLYSSLRVKRQTLEDVFLTLAADARK